MLRKRTTSLSSRSNMDRLNEIQSSNSHDHGHSSNSGLHSNGQGGPRSTFRFVMLIFFLSTFMFLLYFQYHVPLSSSSLALSSLSSSSSSLSTEASFIRIDKRIRNLMEVNGINGHDTNNSNAHHGFLREKIISKNINNNENENISTSTVSTAKSQTQTQTLFDDEPFIHIINTRFMQEQGNLTTLAEARLHLFETFTLPSLMEQSSQKFIWVIKVDPDLDQTILEKLVGMIQDAVADNIGDENNNNNNNDGNANKKDNTGSFGERVFVVSSNANYKNNYGSWRGGAEMREVLSHAKVEFDTDADIDIDIDADVTKSISSRGGIHTGNIHLLHRIKDLEASKIMLQTRLDADDGLHQKYLEHIQKDALEKFVVPPIPHPIPDTDTDTDTAVTSDNHTPDGTELTTAKESIHPSSTKWFYWCSGVHVKWYLDGEGEHGVLGTEKNKRFCITPGLTLGFNVGTTIDEVPIFMHHKLYKNLAAASKAKVTGKDIDGKDLSCKTKQIGDGVNHHQSGDVQQCLMVITDSFGAIRARTSTSAGMNDVNPHAGKIGHTYGTGTGAGAVTTDGSMSLEDQKRADILWKTVRNRFHVSMERLAYTKAYFLQNSKQIAKENLEGQCTKGHSCKKSSEKQLKELVQEA